MNAYLVIFKELGLLMLNFEVNIFHVLFIKYPSYVTLPFNNYNSQTIKLVDIS